MIRKWTVLCAAACVLLSYGCAEVNKQVDELRRGLQPKKEITDNIFYLSSPEINLKISRDLRFIGKVKGDNPVRMEVANRLKDPLEESVTSTSYIFGPTGNGAIFKRGIIIRIHTVRGDPSQTTPALFPGEERLESGVIKILDEEYRYCILASSEALLKNERRFLSDYSIPNCFLAKCLEKSGSFGNKTIIQILYIEEISIPDLQCSEWADTETLSEIQRLSLDDFIERSYSSIRFMEKKGIDDRTSKYVDAEEETRGMGAESQGIDTDRRTLQQPGAVGTGVENIEKRLQTLKELVEKGLITQEDYDRKKTEILESF